MTDVKQSEEVIYVVVRKSDHYESFLAYMIEAYSHATITQVNGKSVIVATINEHDLKKTVSNERVSDNTKKYVVYQTAKLKEPDEKMKTMKNVILIGNYYNDNLHLFRKDANIEIYTLYDIDFKCDMKNVKYYAYAHNHQFSLFVGEQFMDSYETNLRFTEFSICLREATYGLLIYPVVHFLLGVHQFPGDTLCKKILNAYVSDMTVNEITESGKKLYDLKILTLRDTLKPVVGTITYSGETYFKYMITDDPTKSLVEHVTMICYLMNDCIPDAKSFSSIEETHKKKITTSTSYTLDDIKYVTTYRTLSNGSLQFVVRGSRTSRIPASYIAKRCYNNGYGTEKVGYAIVSDT